MRTKFIHAAYAAGAAALLAAASGAVAQAQTPAEQQQQTQQPTQQQSPSPERTSVQQQVPVAAISCSRIGPPPQPVTPSTEVLDSIEGAYRLSNGQKIELASLDERVVADFGRWHQVPLVAVGPDRFESRDGLVRLRYEADDRVERIIVSYPADRRGRYVDVC
jgi:hypothetical protein